MKRNMDIRILFCIFLIHFLLGISSCKYCYIILFYWFQCMTTAFFVMQSEIGWKLFEKKKRLVSFHANIKHYYHRMKIMILSNILTVCTYWCSPNIYSKWILCPYIFESYLCFLHTKLTWEQERFPLLF